MTALEQIPASVRRIRDGVRDGAVRAVADREAQLSALRHFLVDDEDEIATALHADLGKSPLEAYTTEIGFVVNEIDHALDAIGSWTSPRRVGVPIHLKPGSGRIVPEPLGTVLVIAPWNYPVHLSLAPLVPAIAAGNGIVLKPSEVAPASSELLERRLSDFVDPDVVQVVTGGVRETTALLEEPFDHIFYTGNGTVGKIVMRAAAEHLTPVTLELGGKSPAIVDATANLAVAARRIAWGKFVNAGQTCVAPDYVLADASVAPRLLDELRGAIEEFYGPDPRRSPDYSRIVNQRHLDRLVGLLDAGGYERIVVGGDHDRDERYISPTIVTGVDDDSALMDDEIFGPILPVLTFDELAAGIGSVNARPRPLALYVFAEDRDVVDRVIESTSSGGVTVNHTLLHLAVPDFPFGGVGASGMGAYHGEHGFRTFSHAKPVLRRRSWPDPKLAYPPYGTVATATMRRLL
jgi:aldehyde dehydrogenase (NAD+)